VGVRRWWGKVARWELIMVGVDFDLPVLRYLDVATRMTVDLKERYGCQLRYITVIAL
jgi:hypothetical protein